MIIIETKTGPCFVNEQAIQDMEFDRDKEQVWVRYIGNKTPTICPQPTFSAVIEVKYYNQTQPAKDFWTSNEYNSMLQFNDKMRRFNILLMEKYPDAWDELNEIIKKEYETKNKISTKV